MADWTVLDFFKLLGAGLVVVGELIMSPTSSDSRFWLRVLMDSQSAPNEQPPADPGLTAEEDAAGNDQIATIDGGGNNGISPEDIVDDVLTDLPGPSRDHVFADDLGASFQ